MSKKDPWISVAWWACYKFFAFGKGMYLRPRRAYFGIKYLIQRMRRGYSDEDLVSFDDYLTDVMISGLRRFAIRSNGYPSRIGSHKKWLDILDEIRDGFVAYKRMQGGDYDLECGPEPKEGQSWHDFFECQKPFEELDRESFKRGMELLTEYFPDLWD